MERKSDIRKEAPSYTCCGLRNSLLTTSSVALTPDCGINPGILHFWNGNNEDRNRTEVGRIKELSNRKNSGIKLKKRSGKK